MHTAWHEIVPRPFRRGAAQHGRFNLKEALLVKIAAGNLCNAVAHHHDLLHARPTQVKIAIFEAQIFLGVHVIIDVERRGLRAGKDFELLCNHLVFARFHIPVHHLRRAACERAAHGDHVFAANGLRQLKYLFGKLRLIEYHLHESAAIP